MLHRSFKPAKCKTALKLAVSRIKLLNNKREVQIKQIKRELAQLLESGQIQTARIRVEHVFREEKTLTAYNLIEIYCELIAARLPIIESQKNCPIDLKEAIASVIFATPRCSSDVPELADIKKHLTAKYGKEFVSGAIEVRPDCGVNRMLVEKLSAKAPDGQAKLKRLIAIAEEHNVKWNPDLFSESDPMPAQDLLNGPNTFEMASKIHAEDPPARPNHNDRAPPNTQVPQRPNENFNEQNARPSSGYQNFASTGVSPNNATTSSSFHSEERYSGAGPEKVEPKQSYHRNENSLSSSRQDWTMEFKDATSAAQAAAESAERASIAARAAAELSQRSAESPRSYGYSPKDEPPKSHGYGPKVESPRNYTGSKLQSDTIGKVPENNSFHGRNSVTRDEHVVDKGREEVSRPNERHVRDEYSQKKSPRSYENEFFEEAIKKNQSSESGSKSVPKNQDSMKSEETSFFEEKVTRKQSSRASSRSHSHSSSFGDSQEKVSRRNNDATYFEETKAEKPLSRSSSRSHSSASSFGNSQEKVSRRNNDATYFEETKAEKTPSRSSSRSHSSASGDIHEDIFRRNDRSEDPYVRDDMVSIENTACFDDYGSDNDHHKVDILEYKESETSLYFSPPNAKPSLDLLDESTGWSPRRKTDEKLRNSTSPFHPSVFSQTSVVSSIPTRPEDPPPATFDDYNSPSSDSDEDPGKSKLTESAGLHKVPSEKSVHENVEQVVPDRRSQGIKSRPLVESTVHVTEEEEVHDFSKDSELLSESSSESGSELKFGALTGGFRNKGIKRPPYMRKSSENSFRAKEETENTRSGIGQSSSSSSLQSPTVRPSLDPRAGDRETGDERSSLRQSRKPSLRTFVGRVDSDDDNMDVLLQQDTRINRPSFNRKPGVEPSKKPSPKAKRADSDSDSSDTEEDVPKSKSPINARPGPPFSRRTKASSPNSGGTHSKTTNVLSEESGSRVSDGLLKTSGGSSSYSKPNPSFGAEPKSSSTGQTPSFVPEPKSSSRSSHANEDLPKTSGISSYSKPHPSFGAEPESSSTGRTPSFVPEPKSSLRSSHANEALPKTGGISSYSKPNPSFGAEPKTSSTGRVFSKTTVSSAAQPVSPSNVAEPKSSSRSSHPNEALPKTNVSSGEAKGNDYGFDSGRAYSRTNVPSREPVVSPSYRPESKSSLSTSYAGETLSKPSNNAKSSDQMGTRDRPRLVKQGSPKPTTPESRRSPKSTKSDSPPKSTKSNANEASKVLSRENSSKDNASHVHPKLPDSDAFTAFFQSLRNSRE